MSQAFIDPKHNHGITDPGHSHGALDYRWDSHAEPTPRPEHYREPAECVRDVRWSPFAVVKLEPLPAPDRAPVSAEEFQQALQKELARVLGLPEHLLAGEPLPLPLPVDPEAAQRVRNLTTVAALWNAPHLQESP